MPEGEGKSQVLEVQNAAEEMVHSLVLRLNPRDLREWTPGREAGVGTRGVTNVEAVASTEIIRCQD